MLIQPRSMVSSLNVGGVPQLGPGYPGGFALPGIFGKIGGGILKVAGAALGLRSAGPNAVGAGAPPQTAAFLPRGTGSGGLRIPAGNTRAADALIRQLTGEPDFGDVRSGASTTAPRRFGARRRMNPLNLRALRRSDRRLEAFAKIAKRYVSSSAPQRVVRTKRGRR